MTEKENEESKKKPTKRRIWQVSTAILGILLVFSVYLGVFSYVMRAGTETQSSSEVAEKTLEYINENLLQESTQAKLVNVSKTHGLYLLELNVGGRKIQTYVSKDGELFFPKVINLAQPNIPKTNKPTVELFVMAYCPYGTQMEKGILPVVNKLGDKIDFEIKFVNYAMHGKKELEEQLRQYCVQENYEDKYLTYLSKFLETKNTTKALQEIGLTREDISSCVKETDEKYDVMKLYNDPQKSEWQGRYPPFKVYDEKNKKYNVQGSPTLVINEKKVESGRDPQSLLDTICGAFKKKPEECSANLSSKSPSTGFGFDEQEGSTSTGGGCGQ